MSATREERTYKVGDAYYTARIHEEKDRVYQSLYNNSEANEVLSLVKSCIIGANPDAELTGIAEATVKEKTFWLTKEQDNILILNADEGFLMSSEKLNKQKHKLITDELLSTAAAVVRAFTRYSTREAKSEVKAHTQPSINKPSSNKNVSNHAMFTGRAFRLESKNEMITLLQPSKITNAICKKQAIFNGKSFRLDDAAVSVLVETAARRRRNKK